MDRCNAGINEHVPVVVIRHKLYQHTQCDEYGCCNKAIEILKKNRTLLDINRIPKDIVTKLRRLILSNCGRVSLLLNELSF